MYENERPTSKLKVGSAVIVWSETYLYHPTEFKTGQIEAETKESWIVRIKNEKIEFNKNTLYDV